MRTDLDVPDLDPAPAPETAPAPEADVRASAALELIPAFPASDDRTERRRSSRRKAAWAACVLVLLALLAVLFVHFTPLQAHSKQGGSVSQELLDAIARLRGRFVDWSSSWLGWHPDGAAARVGWAARPGSASSKFAPLSSDGTGSRGPGSALGRAADKAPRPEGEGSYAEPRSSPAPLLGDVSESIGRSAVAKKAAGEARSETVVGAGGRSGSADAAGGGRKPHKIASSGYSGTGTGLTTGAAMGAAKPTLAPRNPQQSPNVFAAAEALVFDLGGGGVRPGGDIRFDFDGDGRPRHSYDIDSNSGVLVFDADRNGNPGRNGRGLFGTSTDLVGGGRPNGYRDGPEAFTALIAKAENDRVLPRGTIDRHWLGPDALDALGRAYGLAMRVGSFGNRPVSLPAAGVREIYLPNAPTALETDANGDPRDGLFVRMDGTKGRYMNFFLPPRDEQTAKSMKKGTRPKLDPLPWTRDVSKGSALKTFDGPQSTSPDPSR